MTRTENPTGYSEGHPWYYVLCGKVPTPREICEDARTSGYRGFMRHDIEKTDALAEPKRSAGLRTIREKVVADLQRDLSGCRKAAFALHALRGAHPEPWDKPACDDVHVAVGLKHSHLYNDFALLIWLDDLLTHQPDLFA